MESPSVTYEYREFATITADTFTNDDGSFDYEGYAAAYGKIDSWNNALTDHSHDPSADPGRGWTKAPLSAPVDGGYHRKADVDINNDGNIGTGETEILSIGYEKRVAE